MQNKLCRMTRTLQIAAILALTSLCARSQTEFKVTEGLWNQAANWSGGVPTTQEARVGSATLSPAKATLQVGDLLTAGTLSIGQIAGSMGEVHQTGGTLNLRTNYWRVGYRGVGTYRLENGQLLDDARRTDRRDRQVRLHVDGVPGGQRREGADRALRDGADHPIVACFRMAGQGRHPARFSLQKSVRPSS